MGARYVLNAHQSGKLFLQRFQSVLNGINENFIFKIIVFLTKRM
ncbi:MAG: hypothetical protein WDN26_21465 [Chitinophagaceae bacterium]